MTVKHDDISIDGDDLRHLRTAREAAGGSLASVMFRELGLSPDEMPSTLVASMDSFFEALAADGRVTLLSGPRVELEAILAVVGRGATPSEQPFELDIPEGLLTEAHDAAKEDGLAMEALLLKLVTEGLAARAVRSSAGPSENQDMQACPLRP